MKLVGKVKGRVKRWEGVGTGTQGQLAINSVLFSLSWTLLQVLITDLGQEVVRSSNQTLRMASLLVSFATLVVIVASTCVDAADRSVAWSSGEWSSLR
jgi:Na+-driven multidrug efflux pump